MEAVPSLLQAHNALRFFSVVGKLKTLKRTGWVNNEIPLPEVCTVYTTNPQFMLYSIF
jgi:hypothetical protein